MLAAAAATARQKLRKVTPRFFWCYSDEGMIGQLVVAESCRLSTMSTTALFKWLTFVFAEDLDN